MLLPNLVDPFSGSEHIACDLLTLSFGHLAEHFIEVFASAAAYSFLNKLYVRYFLIDAFIDDTEGKSFNHIDVTIPGLLFADSSL